MKSYLSYFKLKFITGLQYRAAALAGMATQLFFGFVFISIYIACYNSGNSDLPMELSNLLVIYGYARYFLVLYMSFIVTKR